MVVLAIFSADDLLITTFGPFVDDVAAERWAARHLRKIPDEAGVYYEITGLSKSRDQINALFDLLGVE